MVVNNTACFSLQLQGDHMPRIITIFSLFCCLSLHAQSLLLDDFDSGTGKNRIDLDWFYYSDVNDTGNSVIHQVTQSV